ncbi:MAG: D-alanyl-D-alanine carboxypeptidase, partial [Streptomyces sp.]
MRDTAAEVRDTAIRAYRKIRAGARRYEQRIRQHWRTATPQQRQTARVTAGSAALGLVVAVTAVAATGPWDSGQRTAERSRAAAQDRDRGSGTHHTGAGRGRGGARVASEVLAGLNSEARPSHGPGAAGVPPPSASGLADTLEPLFKDGSFGPVRTASVVDAATGKQLYAVKPRTPATPASTVKLATAVAALSARGADHRIETRAVRGDGDGEVVLVGGGDPTLSADDLD